MEDWLFGLPPEGRPLDEQEEIVAARMAANPAAREIDDDEAEAFMAVAVFVRNAGQDVLRVFARCAGVPYTGHTGRGRKFMMLRILRRWRNKQRRTALTDLLRYIGTNPIGSVVENGDTITTEMLADLFGKGFNIVWLTRMMRMLGRADEIPAFLAGVAEWGEREYRLWLDMSRLKVREIVYGDTSQPREAGAPGQQQAKLERKLRSKEALIQSLASDRQQMEQSRRAMRGTATRTEEELQELLEQARQDVAAAARDLERRRSEQERELADQEARHRARVQVLKGRLAEARREYAAAIGEREAWLAGWSG